MTIAGRTMQLIQIGGKRATLQIISVILVFDQVYARLGTSAYTHFFIKACVMFI